MFELYIDIRYAGGVAVGTVKNDETIRQVLVSQYLNLWGG